MECIIKFEKAKQPGYALTKGTVECEGFNQTFSNDKELHECIDNLTEYELRLSRLR